MGDDGTTWEPAADAVATCVVAQGAGGSTHSPLFDGIAAGLTAGGVSSLRFDFPYTRAGRRGPDRPPVLLQAWREALDDAAGRGDGSPLVASGKSMGGRMASMLAAEDGDAFAARALVFFGYPLHPPGRVDQLRVEHLPRITVPMLFIQGTRDAFAQRELLTPVVDALGSRARIDWIEGGDHSHRVRGAKRSDAEIGRGLGVDAAAFVLDVIG